MTDSEDPTDSLRHRLKVHRAQKEFRDWIEKVEAVRFVREEVDEDELPHDYEIWKRFSLYENEEYVRSRKERNADSRETETWVKSFTDRIVQSGTFWLSTGQHAPLPWLLLRTSSPELAVWKLWGELTSKDFLLMTQSGDDIVGFLEEEWEYQACRLPEGR